VQEWKLLLLVAAAMLLAREWSTNGAVDGTFMVAAGEDGGGGCHGGWKGN